MGLILYIKLIFFSLDMINVDSSGALADFQSFWVIWGDIKSTQRWLTGPLYVVASMINYWNEKG